MIIKITPYEHGNSYKLRQTNNAHANPAFKSHRLDEFTKVMPLDKAISEVSNALKNSKFAFEQAFSNPEGSIVFDEFSFISRKTRLEKIILVMKYSKPNIKGEFTIAQGTSNDIIKTLQQNNFQQDLIKRLQEASDNAIGI